MATVCTFKSYGPRTGNAISEVSGTISLNDVNFLNISSPWAPVPVVVTADKMRVHHISAAQAQAAGIPPGAYERQEGAVYRRTE